MRLRAISITIIICTLIASSLSKAVILDDMKNILPLKSYELITRLFFDTDKKEKERIYHIEHERLELTESCLWNPGEKEIKTHTLKSLNHNQCPLACIINDAQVIYAHHIDSCSLNDFTPPEVINFAKQCKLNIKRSFENDEELYIAIHIHKDHLLQSSSSNINKIMTKYANATLLLIDRDKEGMILLNKKLNANKYDKKVQSIIIDYSIDWLDYEINAQERTVKVFRSSNRAFLKKLAI